MADKKLKARIIHKNDTEENWKKATAFTPLKGELIIYNPDDTHPDYRCKFGDGVTNVNDLPFFDSLGDSDIIDAGNISEY